MIYYGLLPPLIFEAGFTMRKRKFFANFGTIFLYAVIGTLIAIVATGTLLWALNLDGSIDPNLNVNHFMLFGALISSTDPIATLGILKSAGANPLLYDLIFGESALNDCIAIVVFHIFHDLAIASDGRRLDAGDGIRAWRTRSICPSWCCPPCGASSAFAAYSRAPAAWTAAPARRWRPPARP